MNSNRRDFLKASIFGSLALGIPSVAAACASPAPESTETATGGAVKLVAPKRQGESVMGLRTDPIEKVRIGIVGVGSRGSGAVYRLAQVPDCEIVAICDVRPEQIAKSQKTLADAKKPVAKEFTGEEGWKQMCEEKDIDLIYNCTPWLLHTPIAVYAMEHGKHVVVEVPAALTIEQCWQLVDTSEKTRRHCMMLENCCYDFFELTTLNMARQGLFGEIIHGEGAYIHDLRSMNLTDGDYYKNWRIEYNAIHTGNPYPTHGLGPIAQIMGINQGDRFDYMTSMSTNEYGLTLYAKDHFGPDSPQAKRGYKLGDMNTTLVHTVKGHTLMIQHDVTSPRPYDRLHLISGTKGMASKYPKEQVALEPGAHTYMNDEELKQTLAKYEHPLSKAIGDIARTVGGHGGMDYIMDYRLIYCLKNGFPLDQSVYDAAAWCSLVELSERSVQGQSISFEVPDFTRGAWETTKPWPVIDMQEVKF